MPYFLTDQYKAVLAVAQEHSLQKKIEQDETANGGKKKSTADSQAPVGLYKSIFLRSKVEEQGEKRRRDRKATKPGTGSPRSAAGGSSAPAQAAIAKKGAVRGGVKTESEE